MMRLATALVRSRGGRTPRRPLPALLLAALTLPLVTSMAGAGVIDPAFEGYLNTLPDDTQVSVLNYMAEQVPLANIDAQLRAERATLADRHEHVITSLQAVAETSQPGLLADLTDRRLSGEVRGYTPYWIANLVVAEMSVAAVREVAARPDVGVIYSNFTVSLIEPVGGMPAPPPPGESENLLVGVTPGLRAINAPRVWHELGITGAGRLVCGLDTGVYGAHVALTNRWRGNHVPWQHAWLDLIGGGTTYPSDSHGHGTHTMGTMVGLGEATGDTVGVAFGAEWIACNAINQGVGSEFDNDVIAAFQWIADPDGDPGTVDDVPDVVQNSWRINESFPGGYTDCDPRWWAVMDGAEAAGCAVVFSAGNEGPSPQTIGSPPDRITTPTNAYAIGAVDATNYNFPYPIAGFSSRGPSGCDGVTIKPEVVAPGYEVYSTVNTGGYESFNWNGTSMAGPHVSGIIPLMREANPNVDVTTMKQVIMDTAIDLGATGEDNTFGWGIPDAYEAVLAVVTGFGEISGTVTHLTQGVPIPGATIELVGSGRTFTTNASGGYGGLAAPGTYDITCSHPAFVSQTRPGVVISVETPVVLDFALEALQVGPAITDITCFHGTDDTVGPYVIEATIIDDWSSVSAARLYYRTVTTWNQVDMQDLGNDRFAGSIPGQPLDTTVDYYIEALDVEQNASTAPPDAPNNVFSFTVGIAQEVFADDAEEDRGWTLGLPGDTATTGHWVREDPIQTVSSTNPNLIYQPEDDHTVDPGILCFLTGNAPVGSPPGENDVDGGCTTLVSPLFDVAGAQEARVRYWRWYTNETTLDDVFDVDISSDGGVTWQPFERVGPGSAHPWIEVEALLRCTVDLTDQMQLRFIACDEGSGSLTEALIDDVLIERIDVGSAAVSDADGAPRGQFRLMAAQPNPFNPFTLLSFEVTGRERVQLRVFDVSGRLVRTLVDGVVEAGVHRAVFDGRNERGQGIPSGTYFVELEAGGRRATEKLSLVR